MVIEKEIFIEAPRARVWQALTDPELTKQYFFHCEVHSTWQVGGPISFKGRIFWIKEIEFHGRIEAIEPGHLLKYTLTNQSDDHAEGSVSTVTDRLTDENGGTRVQITDDVGSGEGAEKRYERSMKGWDKVLRGLKEVAEEG